jgi:ATP-binding cassette, subfamily F, member 3
VRSLEAEISRAEAAIAQCETAMQEFVSAEETQRLSQDLERHRFAHAAMVKEWEELAQTLQVAD